MGYLTEQSLRKLATDPGKYKMEDNSLLAAKLQVWWCFVAGLMPDWLSANVITVSAVGPLALCYAALALFWSGWEASVPRAVSFLCAASVFFFQTMDSVDGKQARRLGTSSPLGDFMDHVVDSVCIMLIGTSLCMCCHPRPQLFEFACLVIVAVDFVVVHWESAKRKVMVMDNGSSITEAQIAFVAVLLVDVVFGVGTWDVRILPLLPLRLSHLVFGGIIAIIPVIQVRKSLMRVVRDCGSGVLPEVLVPLGLMALISLLWWARVPDCRVSLHLVMIAGTVHLASCVTLNRLTDQPLPPTLSLPHLLPGVVLPLLFPRLCHLYSLSLVVYVCWFLWGVLTDFSRVLRVPIFSNPPKKTK